jgi:hypothetical protein
MPTATKEVKSRLILTKHEAARRSRKETPQLLRGYFNPRHGNKWAAWRVTMDYEGEVGQGDYGYSYF